jgi:hypothetical protein
VFIGGKRFTAQWQPAAHPRAWPADDNFRKPARHSKLAKLARQARFVRRLSPLRNDRGPTLTLQAAIRAQDYPGGW